MTLKADWLSCFLWVGQETKQFLKTGSGIFKFIHSFKSFFLWESWNSICPVCMFPPEQMGRTDGNSYKDTLLIATCVVSGPSQRPGGRPAFPWYTLHPSGRDGVCTVCCAHTLTWASCSKCNCVFTLLKTIAQLLQAPVCREFTIQSLGVILQRKVGQVIAGAAATRGKQTSFSACFSVGDSYSNSKKYLVPAAKCLKDIITVSSASNILLMTYIYLSMGSQLLSASELLLLLLKSCGFSNHMPEVLKSLSREKHSLEIT